MDVGKLFEDLENIQRTAVAQIELSGWLVIIDDDLYLLQEQLPEDYKRAAKIKLSDRNIVYAIRQAILPLGGGESFVFHRAKVIGFMVPGISPEIIAVSLYIQERGDDELAIVDIAPAAISAAKMRHEATIKFNFFKEMGDT